MGNTFQQNKPNWKQWIPIYGLYQIGKDTFKGKPSVIDPKNPKVYLGSALYHTVTSFIPIIMGIEKIVS